MRNLSASCTNLGAVVLEDDDPCAKSFKVELRV